MHLSYLNRIHNVTILHIFLRTQLPIRGLFLAEALSPRFMQEERHSDVDLFRLALGWRAAEDEDVVGFGLEE